MSSILKNDAVRLRITPERSDNGEEIYSGVMEFNTLATETFSTRVIKISAYCNVLSGDAYVMNVSAGTYGTTVEFLAYEILLGLYGPALSRDFSIEIKHDN